MKMNMLVKDLRKCKEIIAGDNTILKEILHPDKDNVKIRYSLAHAKVKPNKTSFPHKLKTSEVYYILRGKGIMYIDNEKREVKEGQAIYIPPRSKQCIKNTGNEELEFLCIVDPAWKKENEEIFEK